MTKPQERVRPKLPLEGERVDLRGLRDEDLDALVAAANHDEIARWTHLPHPYTREHAANFIAYAQEKLRLGREFHLAIVERESNQLIGMVGLTDIDAESERAEVAYWLAPESWGRGLASEALFLATEAAFTHMGLTRLYAFVLDGNTASIRMLERFGFHEEGRLRWHTKRDGRWMDKVWFGLLREEWNRRTGSA
ncbi:MAG: GNAT family N-acetyltransferase [Candidatus Thermoplasmatota archaeon]|nr:GNAT family N-acetyltransferase [Candidatus Thermoplasmatota archaeon]